MTNWWLASHRGPSALLPRSPPPYRPDPRVATFFLQKNNVRLLLWGIQKSTLNKLKVHFNLISFYFLQTYFLLLLALQSKFLFFLNISMASLHSMFILKYINNSFLIRLREALFLSSRHFTFMTEKTFSVNAEVEGTDTR